MDLLLFLVLGVCAGLLAGLFGVGGGLIIVPVLVYSFTAQGLDPDILTHLAVGTSLATIVFTSLTTDSAPCAGGCSPGWPWASFSAAPWAP